MQGQTEKTWRTLCELAVVEKDPEKLMVLIEEINQILLEKENRLQYVRANSDDAKSTEQMTANH